MYDGAALGEILVDFAMTGAGADGFPILEAHPGGAPGNFLAAMSRCGRKTAMLAKVGEDRFGALLCKTLEEAGIETRGVVRDPSVFTTLAFVTLDEGGDRSFGFARPVRTPGSPLRSWTCPSSTGRGCSTSAPCPSPTSPPVLPPSGRWPMQGSGASSSPSTPT